jgi:hypothetical protein
VLGAIFSAWRRCRYGVAHKNTAAGAELVMRVAAAGSGV